MSPLQIQISCSQECVMMWAALRVPVRKHSAPIFPKEHSVWWVKRSLPAAQRVLSWGAIAQVPPGWGHREGWVPEVAEAASSGDQPIPRGRARGCCSRVAPLPLLSGLPARVEPQHLLRGQVPGEPPCLGQMLALFPGDPALL